MRGFFSQSTAHGTRSTALHALQWVLGLLLTALPATLWAGAPAWLTIGLAGAVGVVLIIFLAAYGYLLFRDRDALRSEHYVLSKMAMDKGLIGDSASGFIDPRALPATRSNAVLAPPREQGGDS